MRFKKSSDFYLISVDTSKKKKEINKKFQEKTLFTRNNTKVKFCQIRQFYDFNQYQLN